MKRIAALLIALAWVVGLLPSAARAATEDNPFVTDLIAGQHTVVGTVKIWDDGQNLYVKYEVVSPYCLMETHLHVATSLEDIPQVNGNPVPGQFDYKTKHDCVSSYLYTIKMRAEWSDACPLYIAAHAVINGGETAWGNGPAFPGKNWATVIEYETEKCSGGQHAHVIVEKKVINDDGGTAVPDDFKLTLDGKATTSGTEVEVSPGTHTAAETQLAGYTFEGFSGDCDSNGNVTVAAGETKTCTLTNNDNQQQQQAYVIVNKVVINDDGGTAVPDDFKLTLDGNATTSGTIIPVTPGTHTAAETQLSGYTFQGFSGDCDSSGNVTVAAGETKTCTLTNNDECEIQVITANFSGLDPANPIAPGDSVEGQDKVAKHLDIESLVNEAVKVEENKAPLVYVAPFTAPVINGGVADGGGFSDFQAHENEQAHKYLFRFDTAVSNFTLHMLDFGDLNPTASTTHKAWMIAYKGGTEVARQTLSYDSEGNRWPRKSVLYGDLAYSGDAIAAAPNEPGDFYWNLSGSGITQVLLAFGEGFDPNIAFDMLTFTTECASCQKRTEFANFSGLDPNNPLGPGESVEGMDRVALGLNIDALRVAVRVEAGVENPFLYWAQHDTLAKIANGGLAPGGGFSDKLTQLQNPPEASRYSFTFAPGTSVSNFALHMLDFGDLNPARSTTHRASLVAYAGQTEVARQDLSYASSSELTPSTSDYGNLAYSGDAISAAPGDPGHYFWNVSGKGITQVVLEFGEGFDPNIAFDMLRFTPQCNP